MGQTALSVTSRTYRGLPGALWAGTCFGTEGTASALVATAKAPTPCVSVTWSNHPRARGRDPNFGNRDCIANLQFFRMRRGLRGKAVLVIPRLWRGIETRLIQPPMSLTKHPFLLHSRAPKATTRSRTFPTLLPQQSDACSSLIFRTCCFSCGGSGLRRSLQLQLMQSQSFRPSNGHLCCSRCFLYRSITAQF